MNKQKIIIFDFPGHPFQFELSQRLSREGSYEVYHLYNPKQIGPKSKFENTKNLTIVDVPKSFSRNFYKRFFDEIAYSLILCRSINKISPKTIISSNTPIIPQFFLFLFCKIKKIKFVFWLQDIISIAAGEILKKQKNIFQKLVFSIFFKMEFFVLKNCNHVITISEDFDKILLNNRIAKHKITCIPNWSPLSDIPVHNKSNSFSVKNNIDQSFNILYSGTLGFKHNPEVLLSLSNYLKLNKLDAKILIVSEGEVVDYLKDKVKENSLTNILFFPFQDFSDFPKVLATADISLVMLEKNAGQFSVPSKLLSILCSKRIPLVFVDKSNLSARIVSENNCGFAVNNINELNDTISKIINDPDEFEYIAENARNYAEENFDIDRIAQKFLSIID